MNDRSPSGSSNPIDTAHDASYLGYSPLDGGYGTTAQEQLNGANTAYQQQATGMSYTDDPLFGTMPGQGDPLDAAAHDTGSRSTVGTQDFAGYAQGSYDAGVHGADTQWAEGGYQHDTAGIPSQPDHHWAADATAGTPQWDSGAYRTVDDGSRPAGSYDTGTYDTGTYDTGSYGTGSYDTGSYDTGSYDTGSYDTGSYGTGYHSPADGFDTDDTGSWSTTGPAGFDSPLPADTTSAWGSGSWDVSGLPGEPSHEREHQIDHAGQPTEQNTGQDPEQDAALSRETAQGSPSAHAEYSPADHESTTDFRSDAHHWPGDDLDAHRQGSEHHDDPEPLVDLSAAGADSTDEADRPTGAPHPVGRGRRRAAKPKRSALLTVAVPSVAVMGVAGVAAASVTGLTGDGEKTAQAAPDEGVPVKPSKANSKLDTQLAGVSADAGDFAGRASRTQERIDLQERQEAERKRKAEEAARKEAMRPKFALPVDQPGLSAYYGQAGMNWMSLHTGIDFPVSYGVPVKAATDGVVSTKWDLAYGNMAIVTAADGTETWYCHLSSTKIRSGPVKAGDTIAYSGNSGNSTGPHLHFEVRPGGGSAVDPVAWYRAKGLDPT